MKLGIYPGCSLTGSAREYFESVEALAKFFGIELQQISDWNCCGATAAHNLNKKLSLALPARILAAAERDNLHELVVPCAACYSRLSVTQHELRHNISLRNEIQEIIEAKYNASGTILNVIQMINLYFLENLEKKIVKPLKNKVACYYGCLLVRPEKVLHFDRVENPQSMEKILTLLGATPINWAMKTECCGAGLSVSKTDVVAKLSAKILEDAVSRGAEAIIVACPMCHANLDMRRPEIEKAMGKSCKIPVLYLTQAIGLAVGIDEKTLGLHRHFIPVDLPKN